MFTHMLFPTVGGLGFSCFVWKQEKYKKSCLRKFKNKLLITVHEK